MYHYLESGLRNVWLKNGFRVQKTPYGEAVAIEDVRGLHQAIALHLIEKPSRLKGTEVRFLRKEMDMSQSGLGTLLGVSAQSIALWEKGKAKIAVPSDRLLRLIVKGNYCGDVAVKELIDQLNGQDEADYNDKRMVFAETGKAWKYG